MKDIKHIFVLGLGISGKAAADLALKKNIRVTAFDSKTDIELANFATTRQSYGLTAHLGEDCFNNITDKPDLIVISPGIKKDSPLANFAKSLKLPVVSEIAFAAMLSRKPIIAITGTNGKTTTTELCSHILTNLGIRTSASGNTGYPLSKAVEEEEKFDLHAAELSSFQLEDCDTFHPDAAVILNISSDHMDRYSSFDEYAKTKFAIFKNLPPERCALNISLLNLYHKYLPERDLPVLFSTNNDPRQECTIWSDDRIIKLRNLHGDIFSIVPEDNLPGIHNLENILAALALIKIFLGDDFFAKIAEIQNALNTFKLGRHRIELIGKRNGITFINDSKATNPDSTVSALKLFAKGKNILLLIGGLDKEMDFSQIIFHTDKIKKAYIYGSCKKKLFNLLENHLRCVLLNTFEEAVNLACTEAEKGDIVLLSPACASMDEFKNYQERGDKFIEIINRRFPL